MWLFLFNLESGIFIDLNSKRNMMNRFLKLIIYLLSLYLLCICILNFGFQNTTWNWNTTNTNKIYYPDDFLWGTATAAHQVEGGHTNNNWFWWESQKDEYGQSRILNNDKSGIAVDQWNRYPEDIKLMKELGTNSYRFSLSWSKIMPQPMVFDTLALQHYSDLIDSLLHNNIEPNITLHHFEEPLWFMELGGFEKEENINYFLSFSEKVIKAYGKKVSYWTTFNEPNVFINEGYYAGYFPPGKKDARIAGTVLGNILKAHVKTYQMAKQLNYNSELKIGIVMSIFLFEPSNRINLIDWIGTYLADDTFNKTIIRFLETGTYRYLVLPYGQPIKFLDENATKSIDFIGVNYYSHLAVKMNPLNPVESLQPVKGEILAEMGRYTIYPDGIYDAIKMTSKLNVPIYITENGIGDSKDIHRGPFIKRSLFAVSEAIKNGYDIRGFYYWSLLDNFEWCLGYSQKFGLYEVNLETQERTLREGSKEFQNTVLKFSNKKRQN